MRRALGLLPNPFIVSTGEEREMLEALRVLFGLYPHKRGALNQV